MLCPSRSKAYTQDFEEIPGMSECSVLQGEGLRRGDKR